MNGIDWPDVVLWICVIAVVFAIVESKVRADLAARAPPARDRVRRGLAVSLRHSTKRDVQDLLLAAMKRKELA